MFAGTSGSVRKAFGLAAVGAGALASIALAPSTGNAQSVADNARLPAAAVNASTGVSSGDCAAFRHYVLQEARTAGDQMSGTFLTSISRFTKAGCTPRDALGEIQIITETSQDAYAMGLAREKMGRVDILGLSGVKGCHRPPNGVCPAQTGALPRAAAGG